MKPRVKNIVNKIKVQERILEIILKWTNCDIEQNYILTLNKNIY